MNIQFLKGIVTCGLCLALGQMTYAQSENSSANTKRSVISGPDAVAVSVGKKDVADREVFEGSDVQVIKLRAEESDALQETRVRFEGPAPQKAVLRSKDEAPNDKPKR